MVAGWRKARKAARLSSFSFVHEAGGLFVAAVTFNRALVFGLVASQTEGVSLFKIPSPVRRKVGVLVTCVAPNLCLVFGVWKHRRLLARFGLQNDLGRAGETRRFWPFVRGVLRSMGRRIQKSQYAGECEGGVFHSRWGYGSVRLLSFIKWT